MACPRRNFCDNNKNCFDLRQKSTTLLRSEHYQTYTYVETGLLGIKDFGDSGVLPFFFFFFFFFFDFGFWSFIGNHYDLENGIAGFRFSSSLFRLLSPFIQSMTFEALHGIKKIYSCLQFWNMHKTNKKDTQNKIQVGSSDGLLLMFSSNHSGVLIGLCQQVHL